LPALLEAPAETPAAPTEQISYTRRTLKQRAEECVTEQGLRFDETVPVEVIGVPAPELSGPEADQYIVIDKKITRRLAQRPGSYVVLEYHRAVVKHLPSQTLTTVGAPAAVFEGALADVSLLAGLGRQVRLSPAALPPAPAAARCRHHRKPHHADLLCSSQH
jgi:transposase